AIVAPATASAQAPAPPGAASPPPGPVTPAPGGVPAGVPTPGGALQGPSTTTPALPAQPATGATGAATPPRAETADAMLADAAAPSQVLATWSDAVAIMSTRDVEYAIALQEIERAEGLRRQALAAA